MEKLFTTLLRKKKLTCVTCNKKYYVPQEQEIKDYYICSDLCFENYMNKWNSLKCIYCQKSFFIKLNEATIDLENYACEKCLNLKVSLYDPLPSDISK